MVVVHMRMFVVGQVMHETTPPYAPRGSRFRSEPPSVEDDVDCMVLCNLRVACQNLRRQLSTAAVKLTHCAQTFGIAVVDFFTDGSDSCGQTNNRTPQKFVNDITLIICIGFRLRKVVH